jgi:hypothetical protein
LGSLVFGGHYSGVWHYSDRRLERMSDGSSPDGRCGCDWRRGDGCQHGRSLCGIQSRLKDKRC